MKAGAARIDITPAPDAELSGYVARRQPSLGIHDPLAATALYAECGTGRILWINADLIGFESGYIDYVKSQLGCLGLEPHEIMVSATHTHSGPATVDLMNCGARDPLYLVWLKDRLEDVALRAMRACRPARMVRAETVCKLAVRRRNADAPQAEGRLGLVAWRDANGGYIAVLANYPMHNVALGPENRLVSGDVAGHAAATLATLLPGSPPVLWTNGAAGDLNPPSVDTDFVRVRDWGNRLACAAADAFAGAETSLSPLIDVVAVKTGLPLKAMSSEEIGGRARELRDAARNAPAYLRDRIADAIGTWETRRTAEAADGKAAEPVVLPVHVVRLGGSSWIGVGAEPFSCLAGEIEAATGAPGYVVGYANGLAGYLAPESAYQEGGYEVESAYVYYDTLPFRPGGYEKVRDRAVDLVAQLAHRSPAPLPA